MNRECVESSCGDGFVDAMAGEACDDANDDAGDGCEPGCRRSCTPEADDCDDGNPCNGVESCSETFVCTATAPLDCNDDNACTADSCDAALGCQNLLIDADGDGQAPSALGTCGTDCDDDAPAVHEGASDPCDDIDNDCDGDLDEDGNVTWWEDCDGDGYAALSAPTSESCAEPAPSSSCPGGGWVSLDPATSADCNDDAGSVHPGATEAIGDQVDQDCNGGEICYLDNDNDGYRTSATILSSDADCGDSREARSNEPSGDCNDNNASIRPNVAEVPGDQIDQNCDGQETCYRDADGDGYRATLTVTSSDGDCTDPGEAHDKQPEDCCDLDADARPGQTAWFDAGDGPTACGDWDYNCDEKPTRRYLNIENSCGWDAGQLACGTPSSAAGWVTQAALCSPAAPPALPLCGDPFPYCWASNCQGNGLFSCSFSFTTRRQECQ